MNSEHRKELWRILAAAALCAAAYFLPTHGIWRILTFAVPYLLAGGEVLLGAAKNILHGEIFDEEFLMSIATLGAFAIGDCTEAVAVMIFYEIGELFSDIAVDGSRRSIAALMDIRPDSAVVLRDGGEVTVAPEDVLAGETLVIRPGERIPLDGEIIDGSTSVNTAALTGESVPADLTVGDRVTSGTINLSGVIRVRAGSVYAESTAAKILELVETCAEKKSRAEGLVSRFARIYTPAVVIGAVLLALLPPLLAGQPWGVWLERALVFLVVSCPCALVVSVPLTFFGGIGRASRDGIMIKGSTYLEALAAVDTVVFDKTGTLTEGSFSVEAVHPTSVTEAELLDIAAAAESYSSHPVAESIITAHGGHIDKTRLGSVEELAGLGIAAVVDGVKYFVGNGRLMDSAGVEWHECHLHGTVIHIAREGAYLGHIVISDRVKPDAAAALSALRELGVRRTVMLTGDAEEAARAVGDQVGVDEIRAGLLPAQKVGEVERILGEGAKAAFVGDGINDAPVLTRADVGVAMGALGSDAAIESADIVLMDDKPSKLPLAVKIARKALRIAKENIVLALAVKAVILLLGALGVTGMWAAVFGDVGVLILAVLNALRTLRD